MRFGQLRIMAGVAAGTALVTGVACSPPVDTTPPPSNVELKIKSLSPDTVYLEGKDKVTMELENGCKAEDLTVTVESLPVSALAAGTVAGQFTFSPPAVDASSKVTKILTATCKTPLDTKVKYAAGKNTATAPLHFDPEMEPQPKIETYSPVGEGNSVLSQMTVTFDRDMLPSSITKDTVGIMGVDGETTYNEATRTATFKASVQLKYDETHVCRVKGGPQGVLSKKKGRTLASATAGQEDQQWNFKTRCQGCGDPWIGDISAAAGISTGGNYKLFSVTGQPTPVGEAYAGDAANHTYKLQSGFIYATQPSGQQ